MFAQCWTLSNKELVLKHTVQCTTVPVCKCVMLFTPPHGAVKLACGLPACQQVLVDILHLYWACQLYWLHMFVGHDSFPAARKPAAKKIILNI